MTKPFAAFFICVVIFIMPAFLSGGEIIRVSDIRDAAKNHEKQPNWEFAENLDRVSRHMSARAGFDGERFVIVFKTDSKILLNTLEQFGVSIWFQSAKGMKYGVQLRRGRGSNRKMRRLFAGNSIASMLPNNIKERLSAFVPPSEYQPQLVAKRRGVTGDVIAPSISAFFNDSTGALLVRLPAASHLYPSGIFPFNKKGLSGLEIEIGDPFLSRMMNARAAGRGFGGGRSNRLNAPGDREESELGYHKFSFEIEMPDWREQLSALQGSQPLDLPGYLENLDKWSASSRNAGGRGGARRGRPSPGGGAALVMPVSVQAFLLGPSIRAASLDYFSAFLSLSEEERAKLFRDFAQQWELETLTPVLVTMRTSLHESYLDRERWSIFLENGRKELFEAQKVVELTQPAPDMPSGRQKPQNRLMRQMFESNSRQFVMLFPKISNNDQTLWHSSNRPLKLVVISEENADLRVKLVWDKLPGR